MSTKPIIAYHTEDEDSPRSALLRQWAERYDATVERRHLIAAEVPQQFGSQDDMLDHLHARQRIAEATPFTVIYSVPGDHDEGAIARKQMWYIYRIGDGHAQYITNLIAAGYSIPDGTEEWSKQRAIECAALDAVEDEE